MFMIIRIKETTRVDTTKKQLRIELLHDTKSMHDSHVDFMQP